MTMSLLPMRSSADAVHVDAPQSDLRATPSSVGQRAEDFDFERAAAVLRHRHNTRDAPKQLSSKAPPQGRLEERFCLGTHPEPEQNIRKAFRDVERSTCATLVTTAIMVFCKAFGAL